MSVARAARPSSAGCALPGSPGADRLAAELGGAFLDDVAAAYTAARPPDDEGVIHVSMVRLEVKAGVTAPES